MIWSKKILKNNKQTKEYLESLPRLYAVVEWAKYGILELPWSGKYNKLNIPLVYVYCDNNGECDEYRLMPIVLATSGRIISWYHHKELAERLCRAYEEKNEYESL